MGTINNHFSIGTMHRNSYEKNLQLLQELEAGDEKDGLFSCFGVTPGGQVIYFDEVGTPWGVRVAGTALLRTNPLNLKKMPIQTVSIREAFKFAADAKQSAFMKAEALEVARTQRWLKSGSRRKMLWLGAAFILIAITLSVALLLDPNGTSHNLSQAEQSFVDFYDNQGVHINGYADVPIVSNPGSYSPIGPVSISRPVFKQFLQDMNSPALPEADSMYAACVQNHCDPAVLASFFEHESSGGTQGVAAITKSVGNIRCSPGYDCYTTDGNGSFRKYATWTDGVKDWVQLLTSYKNNWGLVTLDEIIPRYAPQSDNNDEAAYIASVKARVDDLRAREAKLLATQSSANNSNSFANDQPTGSPIYETDWVIAQDYTIKHPEVDMSRPTGTGDNTQIHTTIGGVVTVVHNDPLFGERVFVSNGQYTVYFNHLQTNIPVTSGQVVKRGDVIGFMGSTGKTTGPYLGYEIFQGTTQLSPMDWVTRVDN